jgi:hypothetical protein
LVGFPIKALLQVGGLEQMSLSAVAAGGFRMVHGVLTWKKVGFCQQQKAHLGVLGNPPYRMWDVTKQVDI